MPAATKKIQMVDLVSQYNKIKPEIDEAIQNVLNSTAFINGPEVKAFQLELEKYMGVKHVIPCGNGTDALQIAMMALNLKPGDEVITTDFTFIATAEVIALLGLKPVLVDVYPDTYTLNIEAVKKAITPKTKAIVPVHLFGQCADMEELMALASQHNLFMIEDTAQATGASYMFKNGTTKKAGTIGHFGTTSFFPSKNLGCYGDGGALFTNDDELAKKARMITNHGQSIQYHHDIIGVNSRLDSMQAAILRVKLRHLDEYTAARIKAADIYDELFASHPQIKTPAINKHSTHVFHQYTLLIEKGDRNKLKEHLATLGIPAMIYYPVPLHLQKAYQDARYKESDFPVTNMLSNKVLSLPMHTELERETQEYIVNAIVEFLKKVR
jgi:dTDP-4-amino-4,6-dideoxygalactose transaminase